ncbi:MAG: NUDIX pyrophosphatase [Chloroflexi bacterium]|nr:NUDIX pyrophosphatase [Chloroflexota bacterium]
MADSSSRAPFNVLVLPFLKDTAKGLLYAVFRRQDVDSGYWQGITGGGEEKETALEAAKRESNEEAGIEAESRFIPLDSTTTIPVAEFRGFRWGRETYVIPEHCFGVEVPHRVLRLSHEHVEYRWVAYEEAMKLFRWDSNRNALWELNQRLLRQAGH